MSDFLRLVLDSIQYLWPFRRVDLWEKALYIVAGKWQWVVGPGVWPILPWFIEVKVFSVVKGILETPRRDITLRDGTMLSFAASATVQIMDLKAAINTVDAYMETTQELISAVLAEKLAEVEASRVAPDKRGRLLADLRRWVQDEASVFGVEVSKLRFTTFVLNPRTYRLLGDATPIAPW